MSDTCVNGHEWTAETEMWWTRNGRPRRVCRVCRAEYERSRYGTEEYRARYRRARAKRPTRRRTMFRRSPGKDRAKRIARLALETGVIVRPTACPRCGKTPPPARDGRSQLHMHHHLSYDCPSEIVWRCALCHSEEHRTAPARESTGDWDA